MERNTGKKVRSNRYLDEGEKEEVDIEDVEEVVEELLLQVSFLERRKRFEARGKPDRDGGL